MASEQAINEIARLSASRASAFDGIAGRGRPANPKLWKAAKEFEGVFLAQFVRAMRTSSQRGELFEESAGHETFDQMFSEAIARQMAEGGALGLHKTIYRSMGGTYTTGEQDAPESGAPGPADFRPRAGQAEKNDVQ